MDWKEGLNEWTDRQTGGIIRLTDGRVDGRIDRLIND